MPTRSKTFENLRPDVRWLKHFGVENNDPEGKEKLVQRLVASQDLFDVIRAFIEEKKDTIERGEESIDDFKDGAWPYKQAFRLGQRAAYNEVKEFLPDPNKRNKSE